MGAGADWVRVLLLAGVVAGTLMVAGAAGDVRHLRSLLYTGLVLTAMSCLLILRRELRRWRAPVVDIAGAPGALLLASDNARRLDAAEARLDCHAIHIHHQYRVQQDVVAGDEHDSTSPMPRLALAYLAPERGGTQAGLSAVGAGRALVAGGA